MKATKTERQGLITLLTRIYEDIREVESAWDIRAEAPDFRVRIEYFHDAVRALTQSDGNGSEGIDRLSVEMLAYDISMLRYIQSNPLPKVTRSLAKLSPHTEVTLPRTQNDKAGLKPDARVKSQLSDLYKNYAVFFAALLSEAADYNFMSRMNSHNNEVEEMATLLQAVASKNQQAEIDVATTAENVLGVSDVTDRVAAGVQNGTFKKRMSAKDALRKLKETAQAIDKEGKAIEQAHFTFATGQLSVYEGAKDVIKKMAGKGLNIVGDFVENAVRDAMRGGRSM